jgi:hypothetical protein
MMRSTGKGSLLAKNAAATAVRSRAVAQVAATAKVARAASTLPDKWRELASKASG